MPGRRIPSLVAIDLGAESCRVSLLSTAGGRPEIRLVHRFPNTPVTRDGSLFWDIERILSGVDEGLRRASSLSPSPIVSLGVDGWAVDYVRLDDSGQPLGPPFCYRDPRTEATLAAMLAHFPRERLFAMSGAQPLRINTLFQLMADAAAGVPQTASWINLPEYVLAALGGRRVAEYTNATHTGLVDMRRRAWHPEVFALSGMDQGAAPPLVATGTDVGSLRSIEGATNTFDGTRLIATACHDTASAVAGIPLDGDDWAYISSGTWSLVGALIDYPVTSAEACRAGFTNQGAAGDRVCFHKNVNGMWLLKQTQAQLCSDETQWPLPELVAAAAQGGTPDAPLDVDDPNLLLPGAMATRINAQRRAQGLAPIDETTEAMPHFAALIFHSLAARYAEVLHNAEHLTGRRFRRLAIVGGGSRNALLNRLTAEATGLEVFCGAAESSTIGNFAIQLAAWEGTPGSTARIAHWAHVLTELDRC